MSCQHTQSHVPAAPIWFMCWRAYERGASDLKRLAIEPVVAWHLHTRTTIEDNGDVTHETITHPICAFLTTNNCDFDYLLLREEPWGESVRRVLSEPDGSSVYMDTDKTWQHNAITWFLAQDAECKSPA